MTTRRRLDGTVDLEARHLIETTDMRAAEIQRTLELKFGPNRSPQLRTVQRMVRELRAADASSVWSASPAEATSDDRHALEVLAAVIVGTGGSRTTLTQTEAAHAVGIRSLAPDLDAWLTYRLARAYMARAARGEPTTDLDAWLALAPWRSAPDRDRYELAVRNGLPRPPIDMTTDEARLAAETALGAMVRERLGMATDPVPELDPVLRDVLVGQVDAVVANVRETAARELVAEGYDLIEEDKQ